MPATSKSNFFVFVCNDKHNQQQRERKKLTTADCAELPLLIDTINLLQSQSADSLFNRLRPGIDRGHDTLTTGSAAVTVNFKFLMKNLKKNVLCSPTCFSSYRFLQLNPLLPPFL